MVQHPGERIWGLGSRLSPWDGCQCLGLPRLGGGCYRHPVGREQGCCQPPPVPRTAASTEGDTAPDVGGTEAESPVVKWSRVSGRRPRHSEPGCRVSSQPDCLSRKASALGAGLGRLGIDWGGRLPQRGRCRARGWVPGREAQVHLQERQPLCACVLCV